MMKLQIFYQVTTRNFHKDFRLNGKRFVSENDLLHHSRKISSSIFLFLTSWFSKDDFVTVDTSGSTGVPKAIQLKKEYMVNSAMATGTYFSLPSRTTALLCLSTDYIAGKMMLVRALVLGWHLDIVDQTSSPLTQTNKTYDFSAMVPLQVYNSLPKLSQIKKLIVGGGVVSKDLEAKLQAVSTQCYATYGMTETITHIAIKQLNRFDNVSSNIEQSHYTVLPNIEISKDNRDCLLIKAPKVSDEVVTTNDIVELISENEFRWLGRFDTIINSGGIKLIPEQIEARLSETIDQRFFVAGISDEKLGEKLILIVEHDVTSSDPTLTDRIEKLEDLTSRISSLKSLGKYEIPKEIYFVKEFVETETKKIQRRKTLDLLFKN